MASYKVPQDVEADDKLIGPFSFRQFIYLVIAVLGIVIGWGLSRLFIPLAILPLPIIIFFGALALPLRKDQPMEIYLAAVVSFFLKPRKRIWQPDGIQSLVEVVAPKIPEVQRTKGFSGSEAEQRLSYLADIVDTRGWSVRGVAAQPGSQTSLNEDAYNEAQDAPDVLDESGGIAQNFNTMINAANTKHHEEMIERMHHPVDQLSSLGASQQVIIPPPNDPYAIFTQNSNTTSSSMSQQQLPSQMSIVPSTSINDTPEPHLSYSPYPNSMHQSVVQPLSDQPLVQPRESPQPQTPVAAPVSAPEQTQPNPTQTTTSINTISPDIINLANNSDLSIETIAHEAKRIQDREAKALENEVVISLH